jgi:uncharacterized protein YbaR (Trm112 family)
MKNKIHKILRCINCKSGRSSGNLKIFKNHYLCINCNEFYPLYKNIPVLLINKNDFYHLKKSLTPAKYRVFKYNEN